MLGWIGGRTAKEIQATTILLRSKAPSRSWSNSGAHAGDSVMAARSRPGRRETGVHAHFSSRTAAVFCPCRRKMARQFSPVPVAVYSTVSNPMWPRSETGRPVLRTCTSSTEKGSARGRPVPIQPRAPAACDFKLYLPRRKHVENADATERVVHTHSLTVRTFQRGATRIILRRSRDEPPSLRSNSTRAPHDGRA